jgi:hypothetical protein
LMLPLLLSWVFPEVAMPGFRKVIISRPPPSGYSWQVLKGTELVRAGNAGSHAEADAAADRAIAEIEAEASPDGTGNPE